MPSYFGVNPFPFAYNTTNIITVKRRPQTNTSYHRLRRSASPVVFFRLTLEVRFSTDFDEKWLKRRGFTQGCAFCGKSRNFSYP